MGRAITASGPAITLTLGYARAGALMARPWSARCYGVARHREGSRQNSRRGLGRALSPAFRAGSLYPFIPLARGCRRIWRGVILVYWFRRGRGCRPHDGEVAGGAVADLVLLISGPRDNTNSRLRPRGGADGQAVVCPLLRGSSPTRGVAPKQQEGSRACSLSGISGWFSLSLYPLGAWVPKNLARRNFGLLVSAGPRLQAARWRGRRRRRRRFRFIDFRAPALTLTLTYAPARARMARPWSAGCYGVARHREGSRQNSRRGL